jgi:hypothetical protein
MSKPTIIAIDHDDYHASHVGCLSDGRQFFLTTPFVPAVRGNAGREFVALYIFDKRGSFLEARIDDLGTRADLDAEHARRIFKQRLSELGPVEYGRIEVQPFEIQRFGTSFGLLPRPPEEGDDDWWVELEPGNYMAFHEPWDSGEYDT